MKLCCPSSAAAAERPSAAWGWAMQGNEGVFGALPPSLLRWRPVKTLYFDAFSGASGDMILGALVDLGADYEALGAALARLAQGRFELRRRRVASAGLSATKIDVVIVGADEEERNFRE